MNNNSSPSNVADSPHWPVGRLALFAGVCLVTLLVFGYAFENWRGRRAWERCKSELLSKGEQLDWAAYIPKPVPDEQNFMKIPRMAEWFRKGTGSPNRTPVLGECGSIDGLTQFSRQRHPDKVALVEVRLLTGADSSTASTTPALSSAEFADAVRKNSLSGFGEVIFMNDPRGGTIAKTKSDRQLKQVSVRVSDATDRTKLEESLKLASFALEPTARPEVFRLVHSTALPAEDVLEWFHRFDAEFNELYAACQRPHARLDGNYNEPFAIDIPYYIAFRIAGQMLCTRAQAELLVGQPENAIREFTALARLVHLLRASQPTLVEAMIHVAMSGLVVNMAESGLAHSLWQEPQWIVIQEQLRSLDLLSEVAYSLRGGERAAINFMLETYPREKLAQVFDAKPGPTWKSAVGVYLHLCPRGWLYQNQTAFSQLHQASLDALDLKNHRIDPAKVESAGQRIDSELGSRWLYNVVARVALPNCIKALRTAAKNQTWIAEARLACALERFHRAHGEYPEKLEKLAPQFIETLPLELVNGQPFQYHRQSPDGYLLYSVGWNTKDDGGRAEEEADWVWRGAPSSKPANLARN